MELLLVNWFEANLLMLFTTLALIGIPLFIGVYVFSKRTGAEADKEAFEEQKKEKTEV